MLAVVFNHIVVETNFKVTQKPESSSLNFLKSLTILIKFVAQKLKPVEK